MNIMNECNLTRGSVVVLCYDLLLHGTVLPRFKHYFKFWSKTRTTMSIAIASK